MDLNGAPLEDPRRFLESLAQRGATEALGQEDDVSLEHPTPDCLPPFQIAALTAGLLTPKQEASAYQHLADCNYCCRILAKAREVSTRQLTPTERDLAKRFEFPSAVGDADLNRRAGAPKRFAVRTWHWIAAVTAVAIAVVGFSYMRTSHLDTAKSLLADAYAEGRPFDYRLSLPGYAKRGAREMRGPIALESKALIEAERELQDAKENHTEKASMLRLTGELRMLQKRPDEAVEALTLADSLRPGDADIEVDLSAAIALRADATGHSDEYGHALELLAKVLTSSPSNSDALFNLALVAEKEHAYNTAEEMWNRFLKTNPDSGWKSEAQQHLSDINSKKKSTN